MTIKWGDPIECNGVRPDWLRGHVPFEWSQDGVDFTPSALGDPEGYDWSELTAFRLPADHPAYVALARGFTPWGGGESAPDDWDGGAVLLRLGSELFCGYTNPPYWEDRGTEGSVIGYRKRVEYGAVHADGSRSGGQPLRYALRDFSEEDLRRVMEDGPRFCRIEREDGYVIEGVFIPRMTEAGATEFANKAALDGLGHTAPCYAASGAHACLKALGLIRPETTAERFTRETGHAVTEAVEAALNWKGE